jgi:hypothetical protein
MEIIKIIILIGITGYRMMNHISNENIIEL